MTLIAVAVAFLNAAAPTATKREQDEASNRSGRVVLIIVGMWWFSFSLLTFFRLGAYPGPSLPSIRAYLTLPWTRLFETFRYMIELPNLGRFLILYFIFSDGYSVIGSVSVSRFFLHAVFMAALFQCQPAQQRSHSSSQLGVLFALNEIGVPTSYLVLLLVETQALSLVGIALFERLGKWLQNSRGYTPSRSFIVIIAINLAVIGLLPIYAIIGLNDSISWGLKSTGEIFVFGGFYGLMIGSVQTFSRSLFSCMIPSGFECVFFGLYEVTDKGSSWIAPLIAAAVMKATRETCGWRQGVLWCVCFLFCFCHFDATFSWKYFREEFASALCADVGFQSSMQRHHHIISFSGSALRFI